jgi:hypothetical protein
MQTQTEVTIRIRITRDGEVPSIEADEDAYFDWRAQPLRSVLARLEGLGEVVEYESETYM